MSADRDRAKQRKEKLERMRTQERNANRRRSLLIIGSAALVAIAIVGVTAIAVVSTQQERKSVEQAAQEPIEGVQTYEDLSREHVTGKVEYEQAPPVGGEHHASWMNCGVYEKTPEIEKTVHSLEHGAVWITYRPGLDQEQVNELKELVEREPYGLLSPYEGQDSPITASAWGLQLDVDDASDQRLKVFLQKYLEGPQTPEPGAACSGGAGM